MAATLGPVSHGLCWYEVEYISRIKSSAWEVDLPLQAAEFCDPDDDPPINDGDVRNNILGAFVAWRNGSIDGGRYELETPGAHPVRWQFVDGEVAARPTWHTCCMVELSAALRQIGREFARRITALPVWDDRCDGALILFGTEVWASNFAELAILFSLQQWPQPSNWTDHDPVYLHWLP